MTLAVRTIIAAIATEFAAVDSGRIDTLVAIMSPQVPSTRWGDRRDLGLAYLVMHTLKLDAQRGRGGLVGEKLGDIERRFAAPSGIRNADEYDQTSYGMEFKRLRRQLVVGPQVT